MKNYLKGVSRTEQKQEGIYWVSADGTLKSAMLMNSIEKSPLELCQ